MPLFLHVTGAMPPSPCSVSVPNCGPHVRLPRGPWKISEPLNGAQSPSFQLTATKDNVSHAILCPDKYDAMIFTLYLGSIYLLLTKLLF